MPVYEILSFFFACAARLWRRRLKGTWLHARKFVEAIFSTLPERRNFPPKKFLHYENFFNIEEINLADSCNLPWYKFKCEFSRTHTYAADEKRAEQ
jgi:hypothetical protein